jgi:hypothetical protein
MLDKILESKVAEVTILMVYEPALTFKKRNGSRRITISSLPRNVRFDLLVLTMLSGLTDKILQTGSQGYYNCRNSPMHLELPPFVKISFGQYSREHFAKPRATMVI